MSSTPAMEEVEVKHTDRLVRDFKKLLFNDDFSDLTLIVDGFPLKVHRVVLATRSEYFRALLYGGLRETNQNEITLQETEICSFRLLLEYIYTGIINLTKLKMEVLVGVLGLANQYGFPDLERDMINHMKNVLNERNVCSVFEVSHGLNMVDLGSTCLKFIDRYASSVFVSHEILLLSPGALKQVLSRDSLCARELEVFNLVREWVAQNDIDEDGLRIILGAVRWELLSNEELVGPVRQSNLLESEKILDILACKMRGPGGGVHIHQRGFLDPGVNVATSEFGTTVIRGEMSGTLLDGDASNYDHERGYARHAIDLSDKTACIQIKLGMPSILNHLRLLLWDKDQRSYSYFVELSYDGSHWTRVVDYTQYLCRSWQDLYFTPCTVQYIKVVGTHNSANRSFHLVKLEAMWLETIPEFKTGIVVPKDNVVSLAKNAAVIEGVSRSRNALINGSLVYDWDNGYCCHQIGSGAIIVQLNQPYFLSTMRMLLWDVDERFYSYVIQTSTNQRDWQMVIDTRDKLRRSWQSHKFAERVACFIRITGTSNTANEVFHVVHLEAPDQSQDIQAGNDQLSVEELAAPDVVHEVDGRLEDDPDVQNHGAPAVVVLPAAGIQRAVHLADPRNEDERNRHRRNRPRPGPR